MAENDSAPQLIEVEVAYALPDRQRIVVLKVIPGCTAYEAVLQSGILAEFPEINLEQADMGIFAHNLDGKSLPLPKEYRLKSNDRVEIYRPLLLDPKQARLLRAERLKLKRKD
jgi:putative ubiquitin-RnfH superfamily antitoxin RatB of RatAB toxin-antitoxin module